MNEMTLVQIKAGLLTPSPHNPRREMSEQGLRELAESIAALGVLEPLLVRPQGKRFEILAGHRRHAAAVQAGAGEVPCIVRQVDDKAAIEITVTENLQREQLTPLEEAKGLASLQKAGWNQQTMAAELGKSASWVARRMSLLNLHENIFDAVTGKGVLEVKHKWGKDRYVNVDKWPARTLELLAALPADTQVLLLEQLSNDAGTLQMLMPEDVQHAQSEIMHVLSAAAFDKSDATLNPKQGACTSCDLRASCRKSLFDDAPDAEPGKIPRNDRCLNPVCFQAKIEEHNKRKIAEAKAQHGNVRVVSADYNTRQSQKLEFPAHVGSYSEWQAAKKDEPGAVYEYDIDHGKGRWIKRIKPGRTGAKSSGGPTPLKTRRIELEQRRMAWCIKKIHAHVEKQESFPEDGRWGTIPAQLLALACFGAAHRGICDPGEKARVGEGKKVKTLDPWELAQDLLDHGAERASRGTDDGRLLATLLYDHLEDVLLSRTRVWGNSFRSIDVAAVTPECKHVCDVFGLDWDAIRAEAADELPEPPGWARLNADGTPKAKPDKAKNTAKPETAAKPAKGAKKGPARPKARAGGK